jgi:hypothetical protein
MAKVQAVQQSGPNSPEFIFDCPGCGCGHWFKTTCDTPRWSWNGDFERPTISPSIDVDRDRADRRCHSFVENGDIRFLNDSYHALRGQTVPLPDMDD